jgi:hypothetical protein
MIEVIYIFKHKKRGSSNKKPPHHLQPLDNYENDDENDQAQKSFDPYQTNKISIPLDTSKLKDKDHINVDINLRLIDFMPQNSGASNNRSLDDFNMQQEDQLSRYIKLYETNMSRSLPGSSGSLNKFKPLPPLSQKYPNKPYSHQDTRLQHEYDSEIRSEGWLFINFMYRNLIEKINKTFFLFPWIILKRWLFGSNAKIKHEEAVDKDLFDKGL